MKSLFFVVALLVYGTFSLYGQTGPDYEVGYYNSDGKYVPGNSKKTTPQTPGSSTYSISPGLLPSTGVDGTVQPLYYQTTPTLTAPAYYYSAPVYNFSTPAYTSPLYSFPSFSYPMYTPGFGYP